MNYVRFLFSSVSGLLSLVNFAVFAAIVISTGEVGLPSAGTLMTFGAKDPVGIVNGDWWRIITSIFLHIGPLHLMMNSYAIYAIGPQIEETVGPLLFVIIYMVSGIIGSIASAVFSLSLSAGASGAIMGLLGFGLVIECIIGFKFRKQSGAWPRMGAYLINTIFITLFGIFVPNIDNAAHFGGLISGGAIGSAILFVRPNRLIHKSVRSAMSLCLAVLAFSAYGIAEISNSSKVIGRFVNAAEKTEHPGEQVFYYSRALEIDPYSAEILFLRGRSLLELDEIDYAMFDFNGALKEPKLDQRFRDLLAELERTPGKENQAFRLRKLLETFGKLMPEKNP